MRLLCALLFSGVLMLPAGDIEMLRPSLRLLGRRVRSGKSSVSGADAEKTAELGYVCTFILRNTGGRTVKLATGFNVVDFHSEPTRNLFVLNLSHLSLSFRAKKDEAPFPLIQHEETFRIVTLCPGEGTLLSVTCWLPEEKLRPGDKFVIEYAPRNFKRYDFQELKLRSEPLEFKFPAPRKQVPRADI